MGRVRSSGVPSEDWWLEVARDCPYATFFHTPLWSRLVLSTKPAWRDASRAAELPSGTRIVLPLIETGRAARGRLPLLVSTAFGCYGGPIANRPVEQAELDASLRPAFLGRCGRLTVLENPLAPFRVSPGRLAERESFTDILQLSNDFDSVFARFSKGRRYEIRKGKAAGVQSRIASSLEDFHAYFGAYEDSLERWSERATSTYPWELFEAAHRLAEELPDNVRLWLAEVEGSVVAGALVFYWNHHAVYWHGAAYREAFDVFANSVVLADAIEDACRRGIGWFDLNPSGGHAGVADYKKQFGPERRKIRFLSYEHPALRHVRKARRLVR